MGTMLLGSSSLRCGAKSCATKLLKDSPSSTVVKASLANKYSPNLTLNLMPSKDKKFYSAH